MQIIKSLVLAIFLCCFAAISVAQVQQARGKATVSYKGRSAPADVKAKAQQDAELKAVEFYYAEAGESEAANFDAVRDKIIENPSRFILESTILSEEDITAKQQYTVTVRVSLNVANLRNLVRGTSAVTKGSKQERSAFAFLFISRQSDSIKSFDDTIAKRADRSKPKRSKAAVSPRPEKKRRTPISRPKELSPPKRAAAGPNAPANQPTASFRARTSIKSLPPRLRAPATKLVKQRLSSRSPAAASK
jgi:hypothetical protein